MQKTIADRRTATFSTSVSTSNFERNYSRPRTLTDFR